MKLKTCSKCGNKKPESSFVLDRKRSRRKSQCLACTSAAAKAWRKRHPDYEKARYQADKIGTRERHLVRKYKVTLADYARMLKEQNGCCGICGAPESKQHKQVFHIDHCHASGDVRGLLCRGCNHMLGHVKDDVALLRNAILYLRKSTGQSVMRQERMG